MGWFRRRGGHGRALDPPRRDLRREPDRARFATAAGQLTALVGTYAVLVQLLLMSRHRVAGTARSDSTTSRYGTGGRGFATVWLLVGHVVFTTVGYAQGEHVSLWSQTRDFISHYPDVLMAWVGFVLFLAVAVTSVRIARRKLERRDVVFIHLYAYLAVALTFAHQLAVGTDFTTIARRRVVDRALRCSRSVRSCGGASSCRYASTGATSCACTR